MTQRFEPITKERAAAILDVSTRTVESMVADGVLPRPMAIGRRVYWHPDVFFDHLDALLRAVERPCSEGAAEAGQRADPALPSAKSTPARAKRGGSATCDVSAAQRARRRTKAKLAALNEVES